VPTPEKRSPCALPANAGNADIKGAELEVEWHPVAGMTLDASLSKLDFEYTSFTADAGIPVGATAPGTIEDKFSIGAQYEVTLAGGATITPRVDYSHQGGFNTNAVPTAGNRVGGRGLANARVTWRPADGDWEVSAVATNLTDKRYYHSVFDLTALGGGSNTGMPGAPREFSLQVQKKF
jgi:iron complex outermembrane receptor protein